MQQDKPIKVYSKKQAWLRRVIYIILILVIVVLTPFILDTVGFLAAGGDWTAFKETFFSQSSAAQTFLTGFAVTVGIIVVIMYLVLVVFDTTEGGW